MTVSWNCLILLPLRVLYARFSLSAYLIYQLSESGSEFQQSSVWSTLLLQLFYQLKMVIFLDESNLKMIPI